MSYNQDTIIESYNRKDLNVFDLNCLFCKEELITYAMISFFHKRANASNPLAAKYKICRDCHILGDAFLSNHDCDDEVYGKLPGSDEPRDFKITKDEWEMLMEHKADVKGRVEETVIEGEAEMACVTGIYKSTGEIQSAIFSSDGSIADIKSMLTLFEAADKYNGCANGYGEVLLTKNQGNQNTCVPSALYFLVGFLYTKCGPKDKSSEEDFIQRKIVDAMVVAQDGLHQFLPNPTSGKYSDKAFDQVVLDVFDLAIGGGQFKEGDVESICVFGPSSDTIINKLANGSKKQPCGYIINYLGHAFTLMCFDDTGFFCIDTLSPSYLRRFNTIQEVKTHLLMKFIRRLYKSPQLMNNESGTMGQLKASQADLLWCNPPPGWCPKHEDVYIAAVQAYTKSKRTSALRSSKKSEGLVEVEETNATETATKESSSEEETLKDLAEKKKAKMAEKEAKAKIPKTMSNIRPTKKNNARKKAEEAKAKETAESASKAKEAVEEAKAKKAAESASKAKEAKAKEAEAKETAESASKAKEAKAMENTKEVEAEETKETPKKKKKKKKKEDFFKDMKNDLEVLRNRYDKSEITIEEYNDFTEAVLSETSATVLVPNAKNSNEEKDLSGRYNNFIRKTALGIKEFVVEEKAEQRCKKEADIAAASAPQTATIPGSTHEEIQDAAILYTTGMFCLFASMRSCLYTRLPLWFT